jgi:glyoxylase-like metal-dependent hydrolase (beta-lactamase superfamily II)
MPAFEVHTLDLRFQGAREAIAAYLVIGPAGPVLVETGPGSTVPALLSELARFGVHPADVCDVFVTHIHLDHGGAAGWWARQGARIHVHHVGAPHMINPEKLLASAQRIYGDRMQSLWGEYLAVPAEQIDALEDGAKRQAGGLEFLALDTPGHARHHMVYQVGDAGFAGDLAGIRISGRSHVRLPTPPPEFDLDDWLASIERARGLHLSHLYLTHFGAVSDVDAHWAQVGTLLKEYTNLARDLLVQGSDRDAIVAAFQAYEEQRRRADDLDPETLKRYAGVGPVVMSVDGLIRYWSKRLPVRQA